MSISPAPTHDTTDDPSRSTKRVIAWIGRAITYLVYAYVLVVEVILFVGFFLKLFGANPSSGFVRWWYRSLDRVMEPFRGIFSDIELGLTGNDVPAVFDTSILFAMVIYGIIAIVLHSVISWINTRIHQLEREQLEEERRHAYEQAVARSRMPYDPTLVQSPAPPPSPQPGQQYPVQPDQTYPPQTGQPTSAGQPGGVDTGATQPYPPQPYPPEGQPGSGSQGAPPPSAR